MHRHGILFAPALTAPATLTMMRGTIAGKYTATGETGSIMDGDKAQGGFPGVVRMPLLNGQQPSYSLEDGNLVHLALNEYAVGQPTLRRELTCTRTGSTKL